MKFATALITGASSGIGLELARIHAKKGGDVVLVARSRDKLESIKQELQAQYGVTVHVIAEDLADPASADRIFSATEALGLAIDVLINNAGFGGHGKFAERDLADASRILSYLSQPRKYGRRSRIATATGQGHLG